MWCRFDAMMLPAIGRYWLRNACPSIRISFTFTQPTRRTVPIDVLIVAGSVNSSPSRLGHSAGDAQTASSLSDIDLTGVPEVAFSVGDGDREAGGEMDAKGDTRIVRVTSLYRY